MSGKRQVLTSVFAALMAVLPLRAHAQVTSQRLAAAANEPQNWLTYSGSYYSQRYSTLDQITPANVRNLKLQWVYQSPVAGNWQTTPLVVDGIMYLTQRQNDVVALDAAARRCAVTWACTGNDHAPTSAANTPARTRFFPLITTVLSGKADRRARPPVPRR